MSLIRQSQVYERQAKEYSLNYITSQFSGVLIVDHNKQLLGQVDYLINDGVISFDEVDYSNSDTKLGITKVYRRAWALPGIILTESLRNSNLSPAITLPTLPIGFVNSDPGDILLLTTIPKYWYPEVPNGDRLFNYELSFNIPFFEIKNNRQFFKVKQHNILEEGLIVLQLSSLPLQSTDPFNLQSNTNLTLL